jgi:hypothetical protein
VTGQPGGDLTAPRDVYGFEEIDEMGLLVLGVAEEIRRRLVAHYAGWDPQTARTVAGIVDEYAREHVEKYRDDEEDDDA